MAAAIILNTDRQPLRRRSNGIWQLRKSVGNGRRIEISLGTKNRALAEERAAQIIESRANAVLLDSWAAKIDAGLKRGGWLSRMAANVAARSRRKGGAGLTLDLLRHMAERSGGRCEVSGMPFYFGSEPRHPQQPSIDRIDSTRGYEPDNVRLVCLAVNYCMSQWGESVFHAIAAATVAQRLAQLAKTGSAPGSAGGRGNEPVRARFPYGGSGGI